MQRIALSEIHHRQDARRTDAATVAALAESMKEIGLLNPISVRETDPGYELCAGNHRYEAALSLGWSEIDAIVEDFSDLDAELVMIDENLCRAELSPSDRAHYTARRKAIYLEKHPETAHGANLEGAGVAKSATPETPRFTADTAKKTGQSERVVQLHAERGEKVAPDVLRKVRGSHLDNGVYLDALKKLSHDDQREKVERDIKADVKRRERRKASPKIINVPEPLSDEDTVDKQVARVLAAWNAAGPEARRRAFEIIRDEIDTPVMDTPKDAGDIPAFLRRQA